VTVPGSNIAHQHALFEKIPAGYFPEKTPPAPEYPVELQARLVKMPGALKRFLSGPGERPSSLFAVHQPVHLVQGKQRDDQNSPLEPEQADPELAATGGDKE
jgi:hypothetical protein